MNRIVPALLLATLLLGACADGEDEVAGPTTATAGTGSTAATGPTAPTGPTETTAPTGPSGASGASGSLEPELDDGEHFGFIRSVDVAGSTLVLDLAYFLTGEEANDAAAEHGDEVPVPNDYYIVNDNPKLRTLAMAPDVELALIDWNRCCDTFIDGDLEAFSAAIESGEIVTVGDEIYYGSLSPYWLTVEGGEVTRIEEQFLP